MVCIQSKIFLTESMPLFLSNINRVDCIIMVYGLPEAEILDSQFDIAFACGSGYPDSDLQRNDLGVIPNIVT